MNKNINTLYNSYENKRIVNVFINATHASHITDLPDNPHTPETVNFPGKTHTFYNL
jgi:ribonuclease BN (tRNA processing enzyme)